jgi:hypothetical protein
MKHLLLTLLLATLCATGYGQTIKSLGYDTATGEVVANTGTNVLTFTNDVAIITSIAVATVITDFFADASINTVIQFDDGVHRFINNGKESLVIFDEAAQLAVPIEFTGDEATTNAATTRTNLGLPLPALTNTSNVTMMRALAGSTNTNEPFSGTITFRDEGDANRDMVISNGIILSISEGY